jgi:hypothetical protein
VISPSFILKNIKECEENKADCIMCNHSRNVEDVEKGRLDILTTKASYLDRKMIKMQLLQLAELHLVKYQNMLLWNLTNLQYGIN